MKTCLKCGTPKSMDEFGKESRRSDGKRPYCKDCARNMTADYRNSEEYRERERQLARLYNQEHKEERREYRLDYESKPETKKKIRETTAEWSRRSPIKKVLYRAAASAKEHRVPFDLEEMDIVIPEICPILGIPISSNLGYAGPNSPSIDRVIPELGYVRTNVVVISHRANTIKSDATAEDLRKVADWLEKTLQSAAPPPTQLAEVI